MTAIITRERPASTGLVDIHGKPISSELMKRIAVQGYRPDQRLVDLAKDLPGSSRHTVVFPQAPLLRSRGEEIDRVWSPRELLEFTQHVRDEFERTGIAIIAGGAAGAWTFHNNSRTYLLNGTFDIDSDTWKMALALSTSNLSSSTTTYAGVTNEHANANGYTTGGIAQTLTLSGTTTVTVAASASPTWTASGGSIVARFALIYEVSGNVLCYCLLDSTPADVTTTTGNTFTVATSTSIFTLA